MFSVFAVLLYTDKFAMVARGRVFINLRFFLPISPKWIPDEGLK